MQVNPQIIIETYLHFKGKIQQNKINSENIILNNKNNTLKIMY